VRVLVLSSFRRKTAIIFFSLLVDGLKVTDQPVLRVLLYLLRDLLRDFLRGRYDFDFERDFILLLKKKHFQVGVESLQQMQMSHPPLKVVEWVGTPMRFEKWQA